VTSVVKLATPAKALMVWAVKVALRRTRQLLVDGGYVYSDGDTKTLFESVLDDILKKAAKEDDDLLQEAGQVGHVAHAHVEELIKSLLSKNEERTLELLAKLPEDERSASAVIAAICWIAAHKVRFVSTERKAYSRKHGFAGTCDGIGYVCSCDDRSCCPVPWEGERLSLIDWKTSNALRISYFWQAAAYQHCIEDEDEIEILDRWVLRLDKETGEFDPWYRPGRAAFEEDFKGFLNALAMHRSMDKADDWVSGVKAEKTIARRKIAKELRDAEYAVRCLEADKYLGVRKKKGCNGTEKMCQTCEEIYANKHSAVPVLHSDQGSRPSKRKWESGNRWGQNVP
jgi:hypothetical protein